MTTKDGLLCKKEITNSLYKDVLELLSKIEIKEQTNSTNDDAKESLNNSSHLLSAHFAEQQTAGRGRNSRKWISPFGQNIYLSLAWQSNLSFADIEGLSLAIGVEIAESLKNNTDEVIEIKWPNDLLVNKKKLGGILVETSSGKKDSLEIIIGIGINIFMKNEDAIKIDQDWTSLENYNNRNLDRNLIAANLLNNLVQLTRKFKTVGFGGYKEAFENRNALMNKDCEVLTNGKVDYHGSVIGVNEKGELLIKRNNEILNLRYGEVSIREL
jgi:BirA family biotin operon repressor/biotin-[acetyl-CoA-carboxylase] ligase